MSSDIVAPAFIRGKIVTSDLIEFGGRAGDVAFLAPDPKTLIKTLPLNNPRKLQDRIGFSEVVNYLDELSHVLALSNQTSAIMLYFQHNRPN